MARDARPKRNGHFYIEETCIGCGACDHACPGKVDAIYPVEGDFLGRFAIVLEGTGGYAKIKDLQSWARERGA